MGTYRETMNVYFSHGKESGPVGSKIKCLSEIALKHRCTIESIDYTDLADPDARVERLIRNLKDEDGDVLLVGSSMGGYVSLVASEQVKVKAMFLLAPALFLPGYKKQTYSVIHPHIEIVHGWSDEVVPAENSIKYAKKSDCTLHLISGDHRLNSSIDVVSTLFEQFIISSNQTK